MSSVKYSFEILFIWLNTCICLFSVNTRFFFRSDLSLISQVQNFLSEIFLLMNENSTSSRALI
jgi:hypothetical protein